MQPEACMRWCTQHDSMLYTCADSENFSGRGGGVVQGVILLDLFSWILQCDYYNIFEFRACYIDTVDLNSCMNMDDCLWYKCNEWIKRCFIQKLRSLIFAYINFALIPKIPPLIDPSDHKVLRREIFWTAGLSRLMVASILWFWG